MYPKASKIKQSLLSQTAVNGIFIQLNAAEMVEIAGIVGYDFVVIDCEHGSIDYTSACGLIRAAEAVGVVPLVRVVDHDPAFVGKILEAGAMGVMVPNVSTAKQMQDVMAAVTYKSGDNGGRRGACPGIRAAGHQASNWREFVEWSNLNMIVIPLIESIEGINNFDEIIKVPGIDGVGIGTFDLSHTLGFYGSRNVPELDAIYDQLTAKLLQAGITFCRQPLPLSQPHDPTDVTRSPQAYRVDRERWLKRGARIFVVGSDRGLVKEALGHRLAIMTSP